eukprot:CAMPEP_0172747034 /NCGR_PEP_ID=MMETSP1074-20121228/141891_1 /TAXON_ID=2916 /ORGANISM="Ceratium fusus, Strain PA161109" /LENGTH=68 /DNA_ID=CAMNT_0013578491 /DNA_START=471 /DNA_END=675 /DNA_ORIENTATION=+
MFPCWRSRGSLADERGGSYEVATAPSRGPDKKQPAGMPLSGGPALALCGDCPISFAQTAPCAAASAVG